jgi:hypothetical protein
MKNKFVKYIFCVLCLIPLLFAISNLQQRINRIRKKENLIESEQFENAPPLISFVSVALGSFRGLLADFLWLRVNQLQMDKKYYEMYQLSTWIAGLQPRFPGAIAHLAWNMAYNISVTCSSHKDRWRWVKKGIELLRDQAIQNNPSEPQLYRELAWIYVHKIGNVMDEANIYYKTQMAMDYMKVFGSADPDWNKFEKAPKKFSVLLKNINLSEQQFGDILKKSGISSYKRLTNEFKKNPIFSQKLKDNLNELQVEKLELFLRVNLLRRVYKLDPGTILQINKKYGKLDWRLPSSHAIYWAYKGIEEAVKYKKSTEECAKLISIALHDAVISGRIIMLDPDKPYTFMTVPNFNVIDATIIEDKKYKEENPYYQGFETGLGNFLSEIVVIAYTYGKYSLARKYFNMMKKDYPSYVHYKKLERFAMSKWKKTAKDALMRQAYDTVAGLMFRAYYFAAAGEEDAARGSLNLAKAFYKMYNSEHSDDLKRVGLPPFKQIKKYTGEAFKNSMGVDANDILMKLDTEKIKKSNNPNEKRQ